MVSPGPALWLPSFFETESDGLPAVGVETVEQLLAPGSPGVVVEEQAVLVTPVALAGSGLATVTAKVRLRDAPAARAPAARVQVEPEAFEGEQVQPGEARRRGKGRVCWGPFR